MKNNQVSLYMHEGMRMLLSGIPTGKRSERVNEAFVRYKTIVSECEPVIPDSMMSELMKCLPVKRLISVEEIGVLPHLVREAGARSGRSGKGKDVYESLAAMLDNMTLIERIAAVEKAELMKSQPAGRRKVRRDG